MPEFEYNALTADGVRTSGLLTADSADEAAMLLRTRQLRILQLQQAEDVSSRQKSAASANTLLLADRLAGYTPVRKRDIIQLFQHLAMMVRSGLTVTTTLHLLEEECQKPKLKLALNDISRAVQSGSPLSKALESAPRYFDPLTRSIIASTEETGELAEGAERIATSLDFWLSLRQRVLQALIYPCIVIVLAVIVTVVMVFFFLPKVEKFVVSQGRALPPITRALFDSTHFIQKQWPWILAGVASAFILLWLALRAKRARRWLELSAINLPVLGQALEASQMARLAGLLGVLLRSGSNLVRALDLAQTLTHISLYQRMISNASAAIVAGQPLREALRQPIMPMAFLGVVAAGEESGSLVTAFAELEKFYAQRLSALVLTLVGLLEPALLIAVGGVVGIVYFALFSAITSLVR
jgi:type IV pilus assembly protein PilC